MRKSIGNGSSPVALRPQAIFIYKYTRVYALVGDADASYNSVLTVLRKDSARLTKNGEIDLFIYFG